MLAARAVILLLLAMTVPAPALAVSEEAGGQAAQRLLFIGNSFTKQWDVPGMVARLAPGGARALDLSIYGHSLHQHRETEGIYEALARPDWTAAIFQDFSDTALVPVKAKASEAAVGTFRDALPEDPPRLVFFAPWAPHRTPRPERDRATRRIEAHYGLLARMNGGVVAPVGRAWRLARQRLPDLQLRAPDDHHATLAGAYLAALVLADTIFGPAKTLHWRPEAVPAATAAELRRIAAEARNAARPEIAAPLPVNSDG